MKRGTRRRRRDKSREKRSWYLIETTSIVPRTDQDIGGGQGFNAQEEEKEVGYWRRHRPYREQFEAHKGRQAQSKESLLRLTVICQGVCITSWLYIYLELPAHWIEGSRSFATHNNIFPNLLSRFPLNLFEIDILEKLYEELACLVPKSALSILVSKESAHGLSEPSPATTFEPAKMPTK